MITEINSNIEKFVRLQGLSISNCPIKNIDSKISCLKNLKSLTLSGTEITNLPDEMETLDSLEVLDISNNKLESIPKVVCKLNNLKTLILDRNVFLTEFPEEFGNLNNLESISLKLIPLTNENKSKLETICATNTNLRIIYY